MTQFDIYGDGAAKLQSERRDGLDKHEFGDEFRRAIGDYGGFADFDVQLRGGFVADAGDGSERRCVVDSL